MKRIVLAMVAVGLVGLLVGTAEAQTPTLASLSVQTAATSVGYHPYRAGYWAGYWGYPPRYYAPRVAVVPAPVVVAPPPAVYVPSVPYYTPYYSPYVCPHRAYYGYPRVRVGIAF